MISGEPVALPLLVPVEDDRLARSGEPRSLRRGWVAAAGVALLVHAALLASLAPGIAPRPGAPRDAASVSLVLMPRAGADAALAPRAWAAAPVTEDATSAVVARTMTAAAMRLRVRPMRFAVAHAGSVPVPNPPAPNAMPAGALPTAGGAASRAAPDDGRNLAGLEAAIDQAVRNAATMPEAARRLRREGRVQVRFSYLDGTVGDVAVLRSGQSRLLDDAALRAVRQAVYPPPPASIQGRRLNLLVWIDFRISPA